jgi:hypothetical protein
MDAKQQVDLTPHINQMLIHERDFRATAIKGKQESADTIREAHELAQRHIDNATIKANEADAKADQADEIADFWHRMAEVAAKEAGIPLPVLPQPTPPQGTPDATLSLPAAAVPELNGGAT